MRVAPREPGHSRWRGERELAGGGNACVLHATLLHTSSVVHTVCTAICVTWSRGARFKSMVHAMIAFAYCTVATVNSIRRYVSYVLERLK